jgi:hypothetical protein
MSINPFDKAEKKKAGFPEPIVGKHGRAPCKPPGPCPVRGHNFSRFANSFSDISGRKSTGA